MIIPCQRSIFVRDVATSGERARRLLEHNARQVAPLGRSLRRSAISLIDVYLNKSCHRRRQFCSDESRLLKKDKAGNVSSRHGVPKPHAAISVIKPLDVFEGLNSLRRVLTCI
ncbi:hypothetical protein EVAR_69185_1 [Eumeta japonica]|uniref:Uncharacterized protein n=1 Tax=Eumeta variegata TaxID=151549 RepID=A0A4C2AE78_EUMVA|nr:hypothetical protein EVAR_69185_1 [Eumeta japonica]